MKLKLNFDSRAGHDKAFEDSKENGSIKQLLAPIQISNNNPDSDQNTQRIESMFDIKKENITVN